MKRILVLTTMFVALATMSFGQANLVSNTPHNLSGAITAGNMPGSFTGEICAACHIPHGGTLGTPLWSQTLSDHTVGYTMYTSSTLPVGGDLSATGGSLKCLGCHDDATTIHSTSTISGATFTGLSTKDGAVGKDLTNDHPVGIILDETQADYKLPTNARVTRINASDDYVECTSCHNAHDNSLGSFLITTNNGSALCLDCHVK